MFQEFLEAVCARAFVFLMLGMYATHAIPKNLPGMPGALAEQMERLMRETGALVEQIPRHMRETGATLELTLKQHTWRIDIIVVVLITMLIMIVVMISGLCCLGQFLQRAAEERKEAEAKRAAEKREKAAARKLIVITRAKEGEFLLIADDREHASREACLEAFNHAMQALPDGRLRIKTNNADTRNFFSVMLVNRGCDDMIPICLPGWVTTDLSRCARLTVNGVRVPGHALVTLKLHQRELGGIVMFCSHTQAYVVCVVSHSKHFSADDMFSALEAKVAPESKPEPKPKPLPQLAPAVPAVPAAEQPGDDADADMCEAPVQADAKQ